MKFSVDEDVQSILEFMQSRIPTNKLVSVADNLPPMARLLWGNYQQDPCQALALGVPKSDLARPSQSIAIESCLAKSCADGDFAGAANGR
jgi:hypothetical protein